jgi:hypothetical protein
MYIDPSRPFLRCPSNKVEAETEGVLGDRFLALRFGDFRFVDRRLVDLRLDERLFTLRFGDLRFGDRRLTLFLVPAIFFLYNMQIKKITVIRKLLLAQLCQG